MFPRCCCCCCCVLWEEPRRRLAHCLPLDHPKAVCSSTLILSNGPLKNGHQLTKCQNSSRNVFPQELSQLNGQNFLGVNVLLVIRDDVFWVSVAASVNERIHSSSSNCFVVGSFFSSRTSGVYPGKGASSGWLSRRRRWHLGVPAVRQWAQEHSLATALGCSVTVQSLHA